MQEESRDEIREVFNLNDYRKERVKFIDIFPYALKKAEEFKMIYVPVLRPPTPPLPVFEKLPDFETESIDEIYPVDAFYDETSVYTDTFSMSWHEPEIAEMIPPTPW
jgi:hypothetical protein